MPMQNVAMTVELRKALGLSESATLTSQEGSSYVTAMGRCYTVKDGNQYGGLYIAEMPGCCGIAVLHHASGDLALALGEYIASVNHMALVYYTSTSPALDRQLEERGWNRTFEFKNVKYGDEGSRIRVYQKYLLDAYRNKDTAQKYGHLANAAAAEASNV